MKKTLLVFILIGMLVFLTGCQFEPEETYRVSNLIEMRILPYTRTELKITTPATVLQKKDTKDGALVLYGTIFEAVYTTPNAKEIKLTVGRTHPLSGLGSTTSRSFMVPTKHRALRSSRWSGSRKSGSFGSLDPTNKPFGTSTVN